MDPTTSCNEEYLTIIAPTASEAMAQFSARGLAAQGYSIAGKIVRHQFAQVGGGDGEPFGSDRKFAATFVRRAAT